MGVVVCCAYLSGLSGIAAPAAQRQEHEQAADNKLKELDKNMNELAAEAGKSGGQARDDVNSMYDEFKKKSAGAKKDLENMRKSTNESWDKAKVQTNKAIDELNGIYEKARSRGTNRPENKQGKTK